MDDNALHRKVIKAMLEQMGVQQVLVAQTGKEAISEVERVPHLVLMDLHLPDFDGIMALQKMKANDPDFNVPVIALTADAYFEPERLTQLGFCDVLLKPVQYARLLDTIRQQVQPA